MRAERPGLGARVEEQLVREVLEAVAGAEVSKDVYEVASKSLE